MACSSSTLVTSSRTSAFLLLMSSPVSEDSCTITCSNRHTPTRTADMTTDQARPPVTKGQAAVTAAADLLDGELADVTRVHDLLDAGLELCRRVLLRLLQVCLLLLVARACVMNTTDTPTLRQMDPARRLRWALEYHPPTFIFRLLLLLLLLGRLGLAGPLPLLLGLVRVEALLIIIVLFLLAVLLLLLSS